MAVRVRPCPGIAVEREGEGGQGEVGGREKKTQSEAENGLAWHLVRWCVSWTHGLLGTSLGTAASMEDLEAQEDCSIVLEHSIHSIPYSTHSFPS